MQGHRIVSLEAGRQRGRRSPHSYAEVALLSPAASFCVLSSHENDTMLIVGQDAEGFHVKVPPDSSTRFSYSRRTSSLSE